MKWAEFRDGVASVNLLALRLALSDRDAARSYLSSCLRLYDELRGLGLKAMDPVPYLYEQGWATSATDARTVFPACLGDDGGTRLDELLILATVTKVLSPTNVFEIGTYNGRTTAILALNAPASGTVFTLDLPPNTSVDDSRATEYIDTDLQLVKRRGGSNFIAELKLEDRCKQLYGDSMQFDPTPYQGSIELGFIDGAHALPYVRNDTIKMATMMADRGLVFWHDYGGKGRFRGLAEYLETLCREVPIYRVLGTTLAWAPASSLRRLKDQIPIADNTAPKKVSS
jgi:hypothetical protein